MYYIWTIGCQMNKADSEYIASHLEQAGYSRTDVAEEAEIIILNSCVVRGNAESRVVNRLNSLKGVKRKLPDVTIALTGCMVDSKLDDLKSTSLGWTSSSDLSSGNSFTVGLINTDCLAQTKLKTP
jgi:tRNA-2-methylthio-N6-dimethylallyladenosine synthase